MSYISVSALSHIGLVRDHNEDSLVAGPWTLCGTVTENPQTLLFPLGTPLVVAVADGLGGHPGGEVASALVVRELAELGPSLGSETAVREAIGVCNRTVYAAATRTPALAMMGTTVAGVVVTPELALVFNVGDSRVFALAADGLRQVSVDDSPPLPPGQRSTFVVTQTLGGNDRFVSVEPHVTSSPLASDTRYLLCTDGLSDPVPPTVIDEVVREHSDQDGRAAFELWKAAIEAGGPDNITLAMVRVAQ